ncbi:uncharacterized protein (DUF2252 family) [Actinopolyspora biskrensis]|uniref:Uncharacterized protein (DUF2252 family) n=1 Tax=Actinopolyspora biskrensis TaxID=1470178 RepID=A0A852Z4S8_9ACTN|nr:DUF2252 domain-containing protein [Actinopolyspora biskrensis]NYH77377.1 uncharacterized protein (DUF2252 family) [Actinopolyspora biskrensis]
MTLTNGRTDLTAEERKAEIIDTFVEAFGDMIRADPDAFRKKFRKMSDNPFAFYRGAACLFYRDMGGAADLWVDERTSRVWVHGDLHAENFGTYMDSAGQLVFDVVDFDEAYLGHFTWDIKRFCTSVALLARRKAVSDADIEELIETYVRAYLRLVHAFHEGARDEEAFKLHLSNTDGAVRDVLLDAKMNTRIALLEEATVVEEYERHFRSGRGVRRLDEAEYAEVLSAFNKYLDTIPEHKRFRNVNYQVKDIVGRKGFGIGSAGLPAYNILVEGPTEALENDVILSLKQGNVAEPSRIVHDQKIRDYFVHHGHRTAVSQRALQAHADPWLGHTELNGTGYVVSELSPHVKELDWSDLTEPAEMRPVINYLGQATAGMHCISDIDSDQTLVDFQSEQAIMNAIGSDEDAFVADMVQFAQNYAQQTRHDRELFVDAFRNGNIPGLESATAGG